MNKLELVMEQHKSNLDDIHRWLLSTTIDNHFSDNDTKDKRRESNKHTYSTSTADDSADLYHARHRRHSYTKNERQRKNMQEKFVSLNLYKISKQKRRRHHSHDYIIPRLDDYSQSLRAQSDMQSDTHAYISPSSSVPAERKDDERMHMGLQEFEDDIQAYRDDMAATVMMLCHLDHIKGFRRDSKQAKFPAIESLLNDSMEPQYTPSPSPEIIVASIRKSETPGHSRSTSLC